MDIPGMAGATDSPEMWEKAEEDSEKLLEELKKEVKAELKDIGVLRKEVRITVPAKVIADHMRAELLGAHARRHGARFPQGAGSPAV